MSSPSRKRNALLSGVLDDLNYIILASWFDNGKVRLERISVDDT